jgi:hypothetical protein
MVCEPREGALSQQPSSDSTRDDMLWDLRTQLEGGHRHVIHLWGVMNTYMPRVRDINHLPEMTVTDFVDTCNKSVPVYIIKDNQWCLLSIVLHNYIYRRWFRPYRSEIERQRFICKFIAPQDLPNEALPSQSTINSIVSMNGAICAEVEARHHAYEQLALGNEETGWIMGLSRLKDHKFHVLQPLFRALLIIISSKNYNNEDSKTIGKLPVFLVRTGIEDGLSAPITFEPIMDKIHGSLGATKSTIKVTLETAIGFVLDLEAREAAVFALQPDPAAAWNPNRFTTDCWRHLQGDQPLIGPSSRFVNTENYPQWLGDGERADSWIMAGYEQRAFRRDAMRVAGNLG